MVRSFVAIEVENPDLSTFIENVQKRLQSLQSRVKPVDKDHVHITLKFLGEVQEDRIEEISAKLGEISRPPFTFNVSGLGCFPHTRKPRVVYLDVGGGSEDIVELAASVERAMSELGFKKEKRRFTPHATIARIKQPWKAEGIERIISEHDSDSDFVVEVDELKLKKSVLTPRGPSYSDLHVVELGG
jgi:2'-5' RNA ligase